MIRNIDADAEKHEKPLVNNEVKNPTFLIYKKKRMNIIKKKKKDIVKRNFAKFFVKVSVLLYFEKILEFITSVIDICSPLSCAG